MTLCEYTDIQNKFKDILLNGLDDRIMQHFRDLNSGILTNRNILPLLHIENPLSYLLDFCTQ